MRFGRRTSIPAWIPTLLLAVASAASAQPTSTGGLTFDGDIRAGYFRQRREERSGNTTDDGNLRARMRLGARLRFDDALSIRVRLAGRFASDQERLRFVIGDHATSTDGLRTGEATFDEAHLSFSPSGPWNIRIGRLQTKFVLADLLGKSLDRSDSPSTEVSWTDGVHVTYEGPRSWAYHLIVQHNSGAGPTNALRPPLGFTASGSRFGVFAALESSASWGRVVQRALDVTYLPDALQMDGTGAGPHEDYVAVVARTALAWPTGRTGGRFLLGGELGYAPNTPRRSAVGLPGSGDVGGVAFQLGITLADLLPGHRFGIVFGQAAAGWLISPDFRSNDRLIEGRYQWAFAANHSVEARVRQRRELEIPSDAERRRTDFDFFFRITSRF